MFGARQAMKREVERVDGSSGSRKRARVENEPVHGLGHVVGRRMVDEFVYETGLETEMEALDDLFFQENEVIEEDGEVPVGEADEHPDAEFDDEVLLEAESNIAAAVHQDVDEVDLDAEAPLMVEDEILHAQRKVRGKGKATTLATDQGGKEPTGHDLKRQALLKALSHLKIRPRGEQLVKLDRTDMASFQQINASPLQRLRQARPEQFDLVGTPKSEFFQRGETDLQEDITRIVDGRKRQSRESSTTPIVHQGAAKRLREDDEKPYSQSLVSRIFSSMPEDLLLNLSSPGGLCLEDIKLMPGLVASDLTDGWICYGLFVVMKNGEIRPYVGKTVNRAGSGPRLLGDYERAVREAKMGYLAGLAVSSELATVMLSNECVGIYARVLVRTSIPVEEDNDEAKHFIEDCEGVMSDYFQTIKDSNGLMIPTKDLGLVDMDSMVASSRELAPTKQMPWTIGTGTNVMSPWRQGYSGDPTADALNRYAAQDNACAVDGTELWSDGPPRRNPLRHLDWCPDTMLCRTCEAWIVRELTTLVELTSFVELQEAREEFANRFMYGATCPVCTEDFTDSYGARNAVANPILEKVDSQHWMRQTCKRVCKPCGPYLREYEHKVIVLTDLSDLQAHRKQHPDKAKQRVRRALKPHEINCGTNCPLCTIAFKLREDADEEDDPLDKKNKAAPQATKAYEVIIPALVGATAICKGCHIKVCNLKINAKKGKEDSVPVRRLARFAACTTMSELGDVWRDEYDK